MIRWFLLKNYLIRSALNVEYTKQSNPYTLLRNSQRVGPYSLFQRVGPFLIISTGGPLLHYFNGWGPVFIISTDGAPSLLFQRVGPFFIIWTGGWGPIFIISTGGAFFIISTGAWAHSLLFQLVGPFLIISRDALGPAHLFSPFVGYYTKIVITFALTIAKLYIFKFKFSKFLWGFRETLSQISPLLYPGLRPGLGLCRHFGFRLLHRPNLWGQPGASCKKFGRAGLNCWEKLRSRCRRHRAARPYSCETPQALRDWGGVVSLCQSIRGLWELLQRGPGRSPEILRIFYVTSCFPMPVDSRALGAPPAGSGAEPRNLTNFLRYEPYIVSQFKFYSQFHIIQGTWQIYITNRKSIHWLKITQSIKHSFSHLSIKRIVCRLSSVSVCLSRCIRTVFKIQSWNFAGRSRTTRDRSWRGWNSAGTPAEGGAGGWLGHVVEGLKLWGCF